VQRYFQGDNAGAKGEGADLVCALSFMIKTSLLKNFQIKSKFIKKRLDSFAAACYIITCSEPNGTKNKTAWGYSSAGRALDWQSRGQRFDPAYLHQKASKPYGFDAFLFQ
jgi:hypothetical protein